MINYPVLLFTRASPFTAHCADDVSLLACSSTSFYYYSSWVVIFTHATLPTTLPYQYLSFYLPPRSEAGGKRKGLTMSFEGSRFTFLSTDLTPMI